MKPVSRRRILGVAVCVAGGAVVPASRLVGAEASNGRVMTVLGPIDPADLGMTLTL